MIKKNEIYKCDICGNVVEMLHEGGGQLVCCNQEMRLLEENTKDAALEKHIPAVEKTDTGIKVKVGEIEHPMDEDHYIEWIELIANDGKNEKKFLNPNGKPEVEFHIKGEVAAVRAYCNLHDLWVFEEK